ncbi:hypothetical protein MRX96_019482 [Rhipicephalus microplus]
MFAGVVARRGKAPTALRAGGASHHQGGIVTARGQPPPQCTEKKNGAATEPRGAAKNVVHSSFLLRCRPCASYESARSLQKARTLWTLFPPPFPSHD